MSSYNILNTRIACPNCKNIFQVKIQFKYGNTWQHKYELNDTIMWGGNEIGNPNLKKVKVYGIIESVKCPHCGYDGYPEECDILVENNIIVQVSPLVDINDYLQGNIEYVFVE